MSKSIFVNEQTISHENGSMTLTGVDFAIELCAPLAKTVLTQKFVNHSDEIVEATYHFPVPKSACVSDIVVSINDKRYTSQIAKKSQAQAQYEEGIESGKRAVLVQIQDDGVYELIIGNVAPNDEIDISLTISQLLQSTRSGYQYFLPTMVAPKYYGSGFIDRSKGLYQTITEHCFFARYPFTATIDNHLGSVRSVSHQISSNTDNQLVMNGLLDKNIVLNIEHLPIEPYSLEHVPNRETSTILVIPPTTDLEDTLQDDVTSVCLVVDCSGSMMGSSIAQLRDGLLGLISELGDKDEVSLICFGTRTQSHTPRPFRVTHQNKEALLDVVSTLDASMGGTNIFAALEEAQSQAKKHDHPAQIVVLTDGWVSQYDRQLNDIAKQANTPTHIVGIGSSANDDFILAVGEACQGDTCFVHPNENMVSVVSNFIKCVSAPKTAITWKVPAHSFAKLPQKMAQSYGAVGLSLTSSQSNKPFQCELNGLTHAFEYVSFPENLSDTLAKIVGSHYIRSLKKDHAQDALAMTIKLGIITKDVSCVMVSDEVVEGTDGLSSQVNIPQMTPDMMGSAMGDIPSYSVHSSTSVSEPEFLDIPAFMRRSPDESPADSIPMFIRTHSKYKELLKNVNGKMTRLLSRNPPTLKQLDTWGLPSDILEWLESIASSNNKAYLQACIAVVILRFDRKEKTLSNSAKEKLLAIKHKEFSNDSVALTKVETSIEKLFAELL